MNDVIHHCGAAYVSVRKTNWGQSGKYLENKMRKSWRVGASDEARIGVKRWVKEFGGWEM